MIIKEFRELRRDRRTLAMLVALPILLLVVFGFAAKPPITTLNTAVVGPAAAQVGRQVAASPRAAGHLRIVVTDPSGDAAAARSYLVDGKANVAVFTGGVRPMVYVDGSSLFAAQAAQVLVASLGDRVDSRILFNPQLKTSWVMVPALVGLILTFIGMLVTSIGLVKERQNGTLEQLAVMPFRPSAVIGGKIVPYLILASADMLAVTLLGILIFNVPFAGSPLLFALGAGLPLRCARPRGLHLDDLADRGPGHPDGDLLPAAADPALGLHLPAGRHAARGALDRLPAAAHLLRQDLPGHHAARRRPCGAVVPVPHAHRDGGGDVQRRRHALPAVDSARALARMSGRDAGEAWGAAGCTVRFGAGHAEATALTHVDLTVPRGEVTAVVGGDGAGKTTLLRVFAGRVIPEPGRVQAPEARRIGFMPSTSGVWRDLTVDENVAFVGRAYQMDGARLAARRRALLGRADLLDAAARLGGRLSGGMRQKLGFCLAMLHEPDLLILDEPSTGVDPVSRVELWRMIAETAATGRAVVMSTTVSGRGGARRLRPGPRRRPSAVRG